MLDVHWVPQLQLGAQSLQKISQKLSAKTWASDRVILKERLWCLNPQFPTENVNIKKSLKCEKMEQYNWY